MLRHSWPRSTLLTWPSCLRPDGQRRPRCGVAGLASSHENESMHGTSHGKRGSAMIESQRPRSGDVVITQTADGFWPHRPLDDRHTPARVDTLEAAVASGGWIADREHVDLWLTDDYLQFQVLVNCRHVHEPARAVTRLSASC